MKTMKRDTDKKLRRLSALMAVTLTASMAIAPTLAYAAEGTASVTKEETVYVITGAAGSTDEVIVSDHLVNHSGSAKLSDVSNLKDIKNVKGDEKFKQEGEKLEWAADGGDIYYQGTTDEEVPVQISASYSMSGEPMTGEEMQGRKGDFVITLRFTNNATSGGSTVPFVVLSGLLLQNDNYSNVTVNKGKVLDDGEKTIVAGIAVPGLGNNLTGKAKDAFVDSGFGDEIVISGRTKSFDVTDIMTIATSSLLSDVDTSSISDLNLDDSVDELSDGARKLVEGTETIAEKLSLLSDKTKTMSDGVSQLSSGSGQLYGGLKQMYGSIKGDGTQANPGLKGSVSQLEAGAQQVATGVDSLVTSMGNTKTGLSGASQQIQGALTAIEGLKTAGTIDQTTYDTLKGLLQGDQSNPGAKLIVDSVVGGIDDSQLAQLKGGADQVSGGLTQLNGGVDKLIAGFEGSKGQAGLLDGAAQLSGGTKTLKDSVGSRNDTSSKTLVGGTKALSDGSEELSDGMNTLYEEGIKKIVDMYEDDLKGAIDSIRGMIDASKSYDTFTRLGSGMDGKVKFIYKTVVSEDKSADESKAEKTEK